MVLKNQQNGKSWQEWSKELRIYDSEKIDALISQNTEEYYFGYFYNMKHSSNIRI